MTIDKSVEHMIVVKRGDSTAPAVVAAGGPCSLEIVWMDGEPYCRVINPTEDWYTVHRRVEYRDRETGRWEWKLQGLVTLGPRSGFQDEMYDNKAAEWRVFKYAPDYKHP
jgi:hypothetical protein